MAAALQVLKVQVEPDHEHFRDALRVVLINLLEYVEFFDVDPELTDAEVVDEFLAYREAQRDRSQAD